MIFLRWIVFYFWIGYIYVQLRDLNWFQENINEKINYKLLLIAHWFWTIFMMVI